MKYIKPEVLNVKRASAVIMGAPKLHSVGDAINLSSTSSAYRSDE
jgi:hypothetical protein